MRLIVTKDQYKRLQGKTKFTQREVALFRHLNHQKQKLGHAHRMMSYISKIKGDFGLFETTHYYYYLWANNYREDGNYKDIKNIILDLETLPEDEMVTVQPGLFISTKIPFISHTYLGRWHQDKFGTYCYVVEQRTGSPTIAALWKERWFLNKYADYFEINYGLTDVEIMRGPELISLMLGTENIDEIYSNRVDLFIKKYSNYLNKPIKAKYRGDTVLFEFISFIRNGNKIDIEMKFLPDSIIPGDENIIKKIIINFLKSSESMDEFLLESIFGKIEVK